MSDNNQYLVIVFAAILLLYIALIRIAAGEEIPPREPELSQHVNWWVLPDGRAVMDYIEDGELRQYAHPVQEVSFAVRAPKNDDQFFYLWSQESLLYRIQRQPTGYRVACRESAADIDCPFVSVVEKTWEAGGRCCP